MKNNTYLKLIFYFLQIYWRIVCLFHITLIIQCLKEISVMMPKIKTLLIESQIYFNNRAIIIVWYLKIKFKYYTAQFLSCVFIFRLNLMFKYLKIYILLKSVKVFFFFPLNIFMHFYYFFSKAKCQLHFSSHDWFRWYF